MENAAIIRKAARELITDARGIQMHGFKDIEYLDLLRAEVETFRILFAEWVKELTNGTILLIAGDFLILLGLIMMIKTQTMTFLITQTTFLKISNTNLSVKCLFQRFYLF